MCGLLYYVIMFLVQYKASNNQYLFGYKEI